ncbi:MAG: Gfo/Idh/MocA family oxidoreductase [Ruminococcaceae bacterium]|nr:Gfo/Idh/MocA family oxidoreductase [Oscillospiraceae bacterium]
MEKLKIAQIGTGHPHARDAAAALLKNPELQVIGFAEPSPEYRHPESPGFRAPGMPYGSMRQYTVEELLEMEDLEAVAIECQEENATEYAQLFADRGVHIYLDKPGTHGCASFEKLTDTCRRRNLVLQLGYMYRYNPMVQKAMEMVRAGKLGKIYAVEGQMSLCYPEAMCSWIGKHKGGMMYYLGCHMVDMVLQFMGGLPEEIIPMNTCTGQYGLDSENYGFAVLKYPEGVSFVKTTCAEVNGYRRRQLVICGEKGTIEIKPMESVVQGTMLKASAVFSTEGRTEQIDSQPFDRYDAMIQDFVDHVRGRSENPYTFAYENALFRTVMACCGWAEKGE